MHKEHEHLQKSLELLAMIQNEAENGHGFELATTVALSSGSSDLLLGSGKEMRLSGRKWLGFEGLRVVVCGDVCWISARTRVIMINLG